MEKMKIPFDKARWKAGEPVYIIGNGHKLVELYELESLPRDQELRYVGVASDSKFTLKEIQMYHQIDIPEPANTHPCTCASLRERIDCDDKECDQQMPSNVTSPRDMVEWLYRTKQIDYNKVMLPSVAAKEGYKLGFYYAEHYGPVVKTLKREVKELRESNRQLRLIIQKIRNGLKDLLENKEAQSGNPGL